MYKRQVIKSAGRSVRAIPNTEIALSSAQTYHNALTSPVGLEPVSYTHLDVYKRQVVQRLEQMGIASLHQLAASESSEIVGSAAGLTGSSCWKNSPQARAAIQAAIDLARSRG